VSASMPVRFGSDGGSDSGSGGASDDTSQSSDDGPAGRRRKAHFSESALDLAAGAEDHKPLSKTPRPGGPVARALPAGDDGVDSEFETSGSGEFDLRTRVPGLENGVMKASFAALAQVIGQDDKRSAVALNDTEAGTSLKKKRLRSSTMRAFGEKLRIGKSAGDVERTLLLTFKSATVEQEYRRVHDALTAKQVQHAFLALLIFEIVVGLEDFIKVRPLAHCCVWPSPHPKKRLCSPSFVHPLTPLVSCKSSTPSARRLLLHW
jgi:hypothetical protein